MGVGCSKKSPYRRAKNDAVEKVTQDALLECAEKVQCYGITMWCSTPCILIVSMFFSTCSRGVATPLYAILVLRAVLNASNEFTLMRRLRKAADRFSLDMGDEEVVSYDEVIQESFAACGFNGILDLFGWWPFLMAFGIISLVDVDTDAAQIAHIFRCDAESPAFNARMVSALQSVPVLAQLVQGLHVEGLLFAILLIGQLIRGSLGFVSAKNAVQALRSGDPDRFTDSGWATQRFLEISTVAGWAHMGYVAAVFRNAAVSADGLEKDRRSLSPTGPTHYIDRGKIFWIVVPSIISVFLLENMPSMAVTTSFLCLQMDHMSIWGVAKTLACLVMSSTSSVYVGINALKGVLRGLPFSILIFLWVGWTAIQIYFAFHCRSHVFSVHTWGCIEPSKLSF